MRNEKILNGKRILLFTPDFFGYEFKIAKKIEEMGGVVERYNVRSVTSPFNRAVLKFCPSIYEKYSINYYEKILDKCNGNYDFILIIKCDMTPISILIRMKKIYPKAKLCLYLWDSIKNIPKITGKFKYFDVLHSFDLEDCNKYPCLKFRPLFYSDEFSCSYFSNSNYKYDICFLGTIHSDRYKVIRQIKKIADKNRLNYYLFCYLQSHFIFYFYKLIKKEFWGTKITDFSFKQMNSSEITSIIGQSKVVLDIQHPSQTGLTMRTIEMLGMNKKIITTNESISTYDFYNPNNIEIISRRDVNIDFEFITKPYEKVPNTVYEHYSIRNWILEVLSFTE